MVLRNANCGLTKTWKIRIPPVVASVDITRIEHTMWKCVLPEEWGGNRYRLPEGRSHPLQRFVTRSMKYNPYKSSSSTLKPTLGIYSWEPVKGTHFPMVTRSTLAFYLLGNPPGRLYNGNVCRETRLPCGFHGLSACPKYCDCRDFISRSGYR